MLLAAASLMVVVLGVVGEGSALAVSSSSGGTMAHTEISHRWFDSSRFIRGI
jgi:hypothetical protein